MANPTRSVYKVYVVDPRGSGKILMDGVSVVADTENNAVMKAGVGKAVADAGLDYDQVDVYTEHVAAFVRPRRETQKVVLAKDPDSD